MTPFRKKQRDGEHLVFDALDRQHTPPDRTHSTVRADFVSINGQVTTNDPSPQKHSNDHTEQWLYRYNQGMLHPKANPYIHPPDLDEDQKKYFIRDNHTLQWVAKATERDNQFWASLPPSVKNRQKKMFERLNIMQPSTVVNIYLTTAATVIMDANPSIERPYGHVMHTKYIMYENDFANRMIKALKKYEVFAKMSRQEHIKVFREHYTNRSNIAGGIGHQLLDPLLLGRLQARFNINDPPPRPQPPPQAMCAQCAATSGLLVRNRVAPQNTQRTRTRKEQESDFNKELKEVLQKEQEEAAAQARAVWSNTYNTVVRENGIPVHPKGFTIKTAWQP